MRKGQRHTAKTKVKMGRTRKRLIKAGVIKVTRPWKAPIYELARGIKVINENKSGTYVMCTLEKHWLFPNSKPSAQGRIYVQRSRVVMTAKLGRVLNRSEHVHHKNEKRKHDDRLSNLEILSSVKHNQHHHTGMQHTVAVKKQIGASLKKAFAEGRRVKPNLSGKNNPFYGKTHSMETRKKIVETRRKNHAARI